MKGGIYSPPLQGNGQSGQYGPDHFLNTNCLGGLPYDQIAMSGYANGNFSCLELAGMKGYTEIILLLAD